MTLAAEIESNSIASTVLATLQCHEIPATPDNYAIWYEYHAGVNSILRRTIDVILANGATFDQTTLHDLHTSFFTSEREEEAIRRTSLRVLETLQDVIGLADKAGTDAHKFGAALNDLASGSFGKSIDNLKELIEELVQESHQMGGRSEYTSVRMRESASKIESLEQNLADALRDASLDGLTSVGNRRSFDLTLRRLAGHTMNSGDDLALLMVDIDFFKRVNDTWGHPVGDQVLHYVAQTLVRTVRGEDVVARYGGEEFAVLLPRADVLSAIAVADNLRLALAREPLQIEVTPPMIPVTISVGVACYEPGDPLAEWIARADGALYRAKTEGRNCVRFA